MIRFFPPRPGITLFYPFLYEYAATDWLAQRKFKGQRNLIYVKGNQVELWSRHPKNNFEHKNFVLSNEMKDAILSLNLPQEEIVIDSELMDAKTKGLKNVIILFDVLYLKKYLANVNQEDRLSLLYDVCRHPTQFEPLKRGLYVNDHIWLAETIQGNFDAEYRSLIHLNEIEGLVLRKRTSLLRDGNLFLGKQLHEVPWMVRVRKEEKNFHH